MYKITERKGIPHVFNLKNGTALRLYAKQCISLSNDLADSPELIGAEKLGYVSIVKVEEADTNTKKSKGGKK